MFYNLVLFTLNPPQTPKQDISHMISLTQAIWSTMTQKQDTALKRKTTLSQHWVPIPDTFIHTSFKRWVVLWEEAL